MAHPLLCPSCNFTTRVSDELFARRVNGRRVKIACRGCRTPLLVDATGPHPRITLKPPASSAARRTGASIVLPPAPLARARALREEELPTLRRNEVPTDEAFLPSVTTSEAPSTSWLQTIPPLGTLDAGSFTAPAQRRTPRFVLLGLLLVGCAAGGLWASWNSRGVGSLVDRAEESAGRPEGVEAEAASPAGAARSPRETGASAPSVVGLQGPAAAAPIADEGSGRIVVGGGATAAPPRGASGPSGAIEPSPALAAGDAATGAVAGHRPSMESNVSPGSGSSIALVGSSGALAVAADAVGDTDGDAVAKADSPRAPADVAASGEGIETTESSPEMELRPFDKNAAAASLQVAEGQAGACRGAGDPSGTARVVVTFAPSGRATTATVSGAPFAGTATGGCIASRFRSARVPPFAGSYVTVTKTVVVR